MIIRDLEKEPISFPCSLEVPVNVPFLRVSPDKGAKEFGVVILGWNQVMEHEKAFVLEMLIDKETPHIFSCPLDWLPSKIMAALGLFKSGSEAKRNGWAFDLDLGITSRIVRVGHSKGVLTFYKPTPRMVIGAKHELSNIRAFHDPTNSDEEKDQIIQIMVENSL